MKKDNASSKAEKNKSSSTVFHTDHRTPSKQGKVVGNVRPPRKPSSK